MLTKYSPFRISAIRVIRGDYVVYCLNKFGLVASRSWGILSAGIEFTRCTWAENT